MSSFDEGPMGFFDFDFDGEKAKLKAAFERKGIKGMDGWEIVCKTAGLDPNTAQRALERGTEGFPETYEILQQLKAAAESVPDIGTISSEEPPSPIWLKLKELLWKYAYKLELPLKEARAFEEYMRTIFGSPLIPGADKFRAPPPDTLVKIGAWHERFKLVSSVQC